MRSKGILMKHRSITTTTMLATLSLLGGLNAATAADLPRKSVPYEAPVQRLPVFTWTGFYVGVNGGYDFQTGKSRLIGTPGLVASGLVPLGAQKTLGDGFTAGATIGYNYQFGSYVAGLEADLNYLDVGKRVTTIIAPVTTIQTQDSNYLGTVRGRLGVTFDRFLIYGTAGLAIGEAKASTTITAGPSIWTGSKNSTRVGWTAGAGVEYALNTNWSVKAEYLYYDLGRTTVLAPLVAGAGLGAGVSGVTRAQNNGNIVRAGINYKF
jgi:outer membrane immunogenic protein